MPKARFRNAPSAPSAPSAIALTLAERAQLVQAAPTEQGDHLVSLQRPGQAEVFGVVRDDKVGRRLVAVALSADEARAKARPLADRAAPVKATGTPRAPGAQAPAGAPSAEQARAAEQTMQSELADYRREVARITGQASKLI